MLAKVSIVWWKSHPILSNIWATLNFVLFYFIPIRFTLLAIQQSIVESLPYIFFVWPAFQTSFRCGCVRACLRVYLSMKIFHHVVRTYQCTPCAARATSQIIKQFHIIFGRNVCAPFFAVMLSAPCACGFHKQCVYPRHFHSSSFRIRFHVSIPDKTRRERAAGTAEPKEGDEKKWWTWC